MVSMEYINYQERLFWVYRRVKENNIKQEGIPLIRDFWRCDIVLKQNNHHGGDVLLLFLREITEAVILESSSDIT